MTTKAVELVEHVRRLGKELGFWRYGFGYERVAHQYFLDLDFRGKTLLEIGCGKGIFSIWASIQGAKHVVGLEPLAAGSFDSEKCFRDFSHMVTKLQLQNIEMLPHRLQDYPAKGDYFDLVLSLSSINHLDEPSCVRLRESAEARQTYFCIFDQIRGWMKNGGRFIIVDCSNRNLFADLGLKNPLAPTIEWFKHHPPEFWASLLADRGFVEPKISWLSFKALSYLRVPKMPKWLAYLSTSGFRLEVMCRK